jgi:phospholipase/carboxylesterase
VRAHAPTAWLPLILVTACAGPRAPARETVFPSPSLEAILREPGGYDSARTYPLLVALHGYGDDAAGFIRAFGPATWAHCFVAVPEAEYPLPNGGFSWFQLTRDRSLWEAADRRTAAAVVGLIDALRSSYRIGPVFVLGFSQGAALAYMTGFLEPSVVSGVLAISGRLPPIDTLGAIVRSADLEAARRVPVFVARGRDDQAVSRRSFVDQAAFLAARGFAVTRFEFAGGHDLPAEVTARAARWVQEVSRR